MSSLTGNMQTGNPVFHMAMDQGTIYQDWAQSERRSTTMTVEGTALKALGLLVVLTICAAVSWTQVQNQTLSGGLLIGSAIGGLIVGLVTSFKPTLAPFTAPLYAALEGFFLGAVSNLFEQRYPGIATQAVGLTFAVMFIMLGLYSFRVIRVTDQLARAIVAATGALALVYLVTFVLGLFGVMVPSIFAYGPIGIAMSVFVVGLAAFNLLLDFDFIERSASQGAPKSMEWFGAFGLMVTLVWLYLEILRLLAKLQSNRD